MEGSSPANHYNIEQERIKAATRKELRLSLNKFWTDDYAFLMDSAQGICNCLDEDCEGCFSTCPRCNSNKCMYLEISTNNSSLKFPGKTSKVASVTKKRKRCKSGAKKQLNKMEDKTSKDTIK